ncbi:MAG: STAS domain-containing protein [Halanaerobacter sp.]
MELNVDYRDEIVILQLSGELDMATVEPLVNKVLEIKEEYQKIIFDFSEVAFVDSTGVGNIIKLLQDNDDLDYAITNLREEVEEIFTILNLEEILGAEVFIDSNSQAIEYLES